MNKNNIPISEIMIVTCGEAIVSALVVLVYLALGLFSYKVILGVLLGSIVMLANFFFLAVAINRAFDEAMADKTEEAMSEDDAAEFAAKHQANIKKSIQLSHSVRMFSMLAVVAAALITSQFEPIATIIPMVTFNPILTIGEFFKRKKG